jgi:nucleoside-diphosphate-sugar epimerase
MKIDTEEELEEALSRPTEGAVEALREMDGDIAILGAGGKMGPSLARMARRTCDALGQRRNVFAVSRFSSPKAKQELERHGVRAISCDLLNRDAVRKLPDAPNVIFMAGQKFGTGDVPELTWMMNTVLPAIVAERYARSRIVVFSTGCVYPLAPLDGPGSSETEPLDPPGEYANTCVGRERVFTHFSREKGTRALMFRLSYAIDLRYGVLLDVAQKVASGEPVDVGMAAANVIWQGDANARAIQCLTRAASPPVALNVTGLERLSIRELAQRFGALLGREARIVGAEGKTAWVFDASRSYEWFGPPGVSIDSMIEATAHWVKQGGATLGKPTHFEARDGKF